jgi:AraC family transcriptional regulator
MSMRRPAPQLEYQKRVHRVENYIALNLEHDLGLDKLATIARFSPFHFHRLFKAVTGEPLYHFIRRLRVERAANLLRDHHDLPIGHIAAECGFNSQAVFSRSFHEHFGMSAREWRLGGFWWFNGRRWEWRTRDDAKQRADTPEEAESAATERGLHVSMIAEARSGKRCENLRKIDVVDVPSFRIAYMRQVGPYDAEPMLSLCQRLFRWVETHGMLTRDSIGVGFGQDNHHVVAPERCRYDVGLVVDPDFLPDYALDVLDIPGGKFIVADFVGRLDEEPLAAEYLWEYWLPNNKLERNYGPVFRRFRLADWRERTLSPMTAFSYQICIPVKLPGSPLVKREILIEPFE